MKNQNIHRSIINIDSVNEDAISVKNGTAYSTSKAVVMHLTKTLVGKLLLLKIHINCISLGWIKIPMNGRDLEQIITFIPYGDIDKVGDLDRLILYLVSNDASKYIMGSTFTTDREMSWEGRSW